MASHSRGNDELVNKFSKNMRKLLDTKDGSRPVSSPASASRSVKFNPETIETSFGGTITPGKIKFNSNKDVSLIQTVPGDCIDPSNRLFFKSPSSIDSSMLKQEDLKPNSSIKPDSSSKPKPDGSTNLKSDITKLNGRNDSAKLNSDSGKLKNDLAKMKTSVLKTVPEKPPRTANSLLKNATKRSNVEEKTSIKSGVVGTPLKSTENSLKSTKITPNKPCVTGRSVSTPAKSCVTGSSVSTPAKDTENSTSLRTTKTTPTLRAVSAGGKTTTPLKPADNKSSSLKTTKTTPNPLKHPITIGNSSTPLNKPTENPLSSLRTTNTTPNPLKNPNTVGNISTPLNKPTENPPSSLKTTKTTPNLMKIPAASYVHLSGIKAQLQQQQQQTPSKAENAIRPDESMFVTPSPYKLTSSAVKRRFTMNELDDIQATPECFNPVDFETPIGGGKHRWSSGDFGMLRGEPDDDEGSCSVTVAVRVRPLNQRERDLPGNHCVVTMQDHETIVTSDRGDVHRFTYDYSFWSVDDSAESEFASQEEVYVHLARPMLGKAFEGYNTCLFAYGQTGSGKSYSIMGQESSPELIGIIPRFCDELFDIVIAKNTSDPQTGLNIEISYFEIYNEKIHDLLCPSTKDKTGKKANLKVREHAVLGPYVEGLSTYTVKSYEDVSSWLCVGNKHRATAATGLNDKSSRSHSVFTLTLTQTKTEVIEGTAHSHSTTSKVNLIDLAGSERQSTAKTSGDRLREGASINKSLHTLSKVISLLSDQSAMHNKKKKLYIPYRDSVLTWLLKESVGGNSKTAMLATIGPASAYIDETLSTLRYARQARNIINRVRVNEDPKARLIRDLKAEIDRLKLQVGKDGEDFVCSSLAEIANLRERLLLKELEMKEMSKTWQEKVLRSEEKKMEESRVLERAGIAFKVDKTLPHLVNLNEDPQLSEMLLYVLKPGVTKVGRSGEDSCSDVQLSGLLIADDHCTLENRAETVTITPVSDAPTYVNGDLITETSVLHHGDRVIVGGDHYFRLNYPIEAESRRSGGDVSSFPSQPRDFEYAKQELQRVQNARLEEELEEAHRQHDQQMQQEIEKQQSQAQQQINRLKIEADAKLDRQKHQYEDRLTEYEDRLGDLETRLDEQRAKKQESDAHKTQAGDVIKKLELEKMMLEQEVISNRKRQEMEARAQQKVMEQAKNTHSSLLDKLEGELQRINSEVQRLELSKQKRVSGGGSSLGKADGGKAATTTSLCPGIGKKDLYKTVLLLREANKISQHLRKHTTFIREEKSMMADDNSGEVLQTLIKVTNTKLGISTYWTQDKFEDKLVRMRDLYEGDTDDNKAEEDNVFYDSHDTWERDDRLDMSYGLSPKLLHSVRQQNSPAARFQNGDLKRRLYSSSSTFPGSVASPSLDNTTLSVSDMPETSQDVMLAQSFMALFRESIASSEESFKNNPSFSESCADKLLGHCDVIKATVTNLLQDYNAAEGKRSSFYENTELFSYLSNLQLGLSGLQLVCSLWASQYDNVNSGLVKELFDKIVTSLRKLGCQMGLFIQGCESDIDTMVQESSSQIYASLFALCRLCGELALATGTAVDGLLASNEDAGSQIRAGVDLRKYFLSGCDLFIDKTLQGGLRTLEDCEVKTLGFGDNSQNMTRETEEIVRQVELTVSSCKILVEKLQQVHVEPDSTIISVTRDSLVPGCRASVQSGGQSTCESVDSDSPRRQDYYQQCYSRSQLLIGYISNLADGVSLLTQATDSLIVKGTDEQTSCLKRLIRCMEMIQKATNQILLSRSSDLKSGQSDVSVLSDTQIEQLEVAGQEITFATSTLNILIKRYLETTQSKSKKLMPVSPSKGGGISHSPMKNNHGNIRPRNIQAADLADFC